MNAKYDGIIHRGHFSQCDGDTVQRPKGWSHRHCLGWLLLLIFLLKIVSHYPHTYVHTAVCFQVYAHCTKVCSVHIHSRYRHRLPWLLLIFPLTPCNTLQCHTTPCIPRCKTVSYVYFYHILHHREYSIHCLGLLLIFPLHTSKK